MIKINLLPQELRVKTKIKDQEYKAIIKQLAFNQNQLFVYAIPVLLGLLVCLHVYFAAVSISKNGQLLALNRKWVELAPQKKALDEFNNDSSAISADSSLMELLNSKRILWAQKLNKLSLNLPSGVWFEAITVSAKEIVIQGSVISLTKKEINLINKLLENLKIDNEFSRDFISFELSNVLKKNVGGYDVADFILTGKIKIR